MADISTNELYNALRRLNRQMYRYAHQTMPPKEGLHRGQIHLLFLISRNDGVIQRDLAEILDIRPSSLTEMLVKLEQEAFVVRKQDEKDQRIMHIYLTENGKAAVNGFTEANTKLTSAIFNCLMEEEIEKMLELVRKISGNLEILDDPASDTGHAIGRKPHGHHHRHHRWD